MDDTQVYNLHGATGRCLPPFAKVHVSCQTNIIIWQTKVSIWKNDRTLSIIPWAHECIKVSTVWCVCYCMLNAISDFTVVSPVVVRSHCSAEKLCSSRTQGLVQTPNMGNGCRSLAPAQRSWNTYFQSWLVYRKYNPFQTFRIKHCSFSTRPKAQLK